MKAQKILAFVLSALLLMGSGGFLLDAHYCQGKLQHVAVFVKAMSCHDAPDCHSSDACCKPLEDTEGCCHNETQLVDYDADLPFVNHGIDLEDGDEGATAENVAIRVATLGAKSANPIRFDPPPLDRDPQAFFQVFRC